MSEAVEPRPEDGGGGPFEVALGVLFVAVAMIGPIVFVQYRYEAFVSEYGEVKEGAAGATLALAVVLRTVSRTVLRTIVRTSARAGIKASMKGALQAGARAATRGLFASMFRGAFGDALSGRGPRPTDPAGIRRANLRSLLFASALLYASWVIVVGLGQPFADLLDAEDSAEVEAREDAARRDAMLHPERISPEVLAWQADRLVDEKRDALGDARRREKGARTAGERTLAEQQIIRALLELTDALEARGDALIVSNGRIKEPAPVQPELPPTAFDDALDFLYTYAPYPGRTSWSSPWYWAGGVLWVLPLWFIYAVQRRAASRRGLVLRHETGVDGGLIQLYFAGAFSFMPLTSDVIVEGTQEDKGRISLVGLVVPTVVSLALWFAWKLTGGEQTALLLASDAFLIYPMVQTFPLNPLDGVQVWRWSRGRWFAVFAFVMSVFMFVGSEGLKNVI